MSTTRKILEGNQGTKGIKGTIGAVEWPPSWLMTGTHSVSSAPRVDPYPTRDHGGSCISIDPRNARRCGDRTLIGLVMGEIAYFKRH
jgi:hypothetical protein